MIITLHGTPTIPNLYDSIAIESGYTPDQIENYDCTKLLVSSDIQEIIFEFMKSEGMSDFSIGTMWLIYGPKTDEKLIGMEVEVQDGFFTFKEV